VPVGVGQDVAGCECSYFEAEDNVIGIKPTKDNSLGIHCTSTYTQDLGAVAEGSDVPERLVAPHCCCWLRLTIPSFRQSDLTSPSVNRTGSSAFAQELVSTMEHDSHFGLFSRKIISDRKNSFCKALDKKDKFA